ncbi:MAG: phosphatase PAP2 family protein [Solirubrobacteraceae bacterium]
MTARALSPQARFLPHGPGDLARQVLIFAVAYYAYRLTRGAVDDPAAATQAFENTRALISIERTLGLFVEPTLQAATGGLLLDFASWMYISTQTTVTVGALLWIYLFRNESFFFVRNMFLVAFALALVGYVVFPTAPPRFMPEWGFTDTVAQFTGVPSNSATIDLLFNPYAAVPSMHVAFAVMIAAPLMRLVRHPGARAFWAVYPLIVTWVIVVTANHWLADAFLGAAVAGVGAYAAHWMGHAHTNWAFSRPAPVIAA